MCLLDTNCFMQLARRRSEAAQVQRVLDGIPRLHLFVSAFTVHSIGVIMSRFGQIGGYVAFIDGLGVGRDLRVLQVEFAALGKVASACTTHGLDFNDGYQYAIAELHGLTLVSLDADFDRTPRGRLTPAAALAQYTADQQK